MCPSLYMYKFSLDLEYIISIRVQNFWSQVWSSETLYTQGRHFLWPVGTTYITSAQPQF